MINRQDPTKCPAVRDDGTLCNFFLYNDNGELRCLRHGCDWHTKAKRKMDKIIPTRNDIRNIWQ